MMRKNKNLTKIMAIGMVGVCMFSIEACGMKAEQSSITETAEVVKADNSNNEANAVIESITEAKDKQDETSENREQDTENVEETVEEADVKEETTAESVSGTDVNPELKEALDAYEEFFNGYVDFMKKYQKASPEDMVAMIGDYADYMLQYTDMMQKLQKIKSEDLSTQDAAYYIEVTARIEQKLLTVTE